MLNATLRQGLDVYAIGTKVRALRSGKKMGLVELGRHTSLSPAMLSKIERGRLYPTLPTLLRIALVFGVGVDYFFLDARTKPVAAVVRRRDRIRFPERTATRDPAFQFESLDFTAPERQFNAYLADFALLPPDKVRRHQHDGGEFLFVLKGTLAVSIGSDEYVLEAEDSMYFDASVPHGYRRKGTRSCAAIVVTRG